MIIVFKKYDRNLNFKKITLVISNHVTLKAQLRHSLYKWLFDDGFVNN